MTDTTELRASDGPIVWPDYTAMDGHVMVAELGADARKWAVAFGQMAVKLGYSEMDEGWLIGWFANAIEHSYDVRTGTGPVVLPDGSGVFVGVVRETFRDPVWDDTSSDPEATDG